MKKYKVTLTQEERKELDTLSSKGKHASKMKPLLSFCISA